MSTEPSQGPSLGRWVTRALAISAVAIATIAIAVVVANSLSSSEAPAPAGTDANAPSRSKPKEKEAAPDSYVVQPGDTLGGIASELGVPVERLERLNPEIDPRALPAGVTLKVRR